MHESVLTYQSSSALIAVARTLLRSCSVITSMCSRSSCTCFFLAGGGFANGVLDGLGDSVGIAAGVRAVGGACEGSRVGYRVSGLAVGDFVGGLPLLLKGIQVSASVLWMR